MYQMPDCQYGMVPDHARSGIAHNLFDALAHLGFIAVHGAVLAGWFFFSEGAFVQPFFGVIPQLGAFLAKGIRCVQLAAVKLDHCLYCLPLLIKIDHETS